MVVAIEQLAPLLMVGVLYGVRARRLARAGRPAPAWRIACFLTGLALIGIALASPLAAAADEALLAHMGEHLLMGDVATILVVLGLTGPLLAPLLRIRVIDRLRVLTHPGVALALWSANLYLWHVPALHEAAVRHPAVHAVQHLLFVGLGINVWMPLFGPLPKPAWFGTAAKLGYIIAVRLIGTLLANVFAWSGTLFYPVYGAPLADQGAAGVLMMVEGSLVTIALFAWLFLDAARQADRKQALLDWASARGLELDDRRAARAVAAGREDELRRRLEHRAHDQHHEHDDGAHGDHPQQEPERLTLGPEGVQHR